MDSLHDPCHFGEWVNFLRQSIDARVCRIAPTHALFRLSFPSPFVSFLTRRVPLSFHRACAVCIA